MRALRLEMLADTPIAYLETVDQAEMRPAESWSKRAALRAAGDREATFLAESAGRIVASAGGMTDERDRTIIVAVYITPAYRGTGLIGRLVEEIAAWSLAAGRTELALEVARENPRAVAAYARLGFVATGATTPHPLYSDVTEQEMVRPASVS
jgi:predicted GNAT family acetyltransferase